MSAIPVSPIPVVATPVFPAQLNLQQTIDVAIAIGTFLDQVAVVMAPAFPQYAPEIELAVSLNAPFLASLKAANASAPPADLQTAVGNFSTAAQAIIPASVKLPIPISGILAAMQGFGSLTAEINKVVGATKAAPTA